MSDGIDPGLLADMLAILPKNGTADDRSIRSAVVEALDEAGIGNPAAHVVYMARVRAELAQAHSQGRRRQPPKDDGVQPSAPYRFVALNEQVAFASEAVRQRGLDQPLPGGFCGSIEVEWAAETPMLIGTRSTRNGVEVDGPLRLGAAPNAPYVIPGATLRGMLRAACEIVAYGRLFQVNRHHRYGVRDFEHALFLPPYRPTWETLNAGWLTRVADFEDARARGESGYTITPARKYLIRIRALPTTFRNPGEAVGDFHLRWLGLKLDQRHASAGQQLAHGREPRFDFTTAKAKFAQLDGAVDEAVPDANGTIDGWYVFAGRFPTVAGVTAAVLDEQDGQTGTGLQKKRECVFADNPTAPTVKVTPDAFQRFELAHTKPSRNKRQPDGSYAVFAPTLAAGGRVPVFYLGDLNQQDAWTFSIGLTRLFKRSHRYSVGEVLAHERAHAIGGFTTFRPDMVEELFGYVYEPSELGKDPDGSTAPRDVAHKGRVAFGFAQAPAAGCAELPPQSTVMMAPRASFAPFYLRGAKDWTDDRARLAGRKRYFPRFSDRTADAAGVIVETLKTWSGNGNTETVSHLALLGSREAGRDVVFTGTIRLHNVAPEEIGMLLWALTHGSDPSDKRYRHMLGRAKGAGAGQMRVKTVRLYLKANDAEGEAMLVPPEARERHAEGQEGWTDGRQSLAPFLQRFAMMMRTVAPTWPRTLPIREWLGASEPRLGRLEVEALRASHLPLRDFKTVREHARAGIGQPWSRDRLLPARPVSDATTAEWYRTIQPSRR